MHVEFSYRAALAALAVTALGASPALAQITQINLVSDDTSLIPALHEDKNLINPWGIAESPTSAFWVANSGSGTSTLYNTAGDPQPLVVTIPNAPGQSGPSHPTGALFNGNNGDFELAPNKRAFFLFASRDGTISGWNPQVDATHAITKVDSSDEKAFYSGIAFAHNGAGNHLLAADFANGGVDVFDNAFNHVSLPGNFTDPNAPAGYTPFNVANVGGKVYVTYARPDGPKGTGRGFVSVFDTDGNFIKRFASGTDAGGTLDDLVAPWAVTVAPQGFGKFAGDTLIGNFGNGKILAFDPMGNFVGALKDNRGNDIVIDNLWALQVGNGFAGGSANKIYFAAGPLDETHGVFGSLSVPEPGPLPFVGVAFGAMATLMVRRRRRTG